MVEILKGKDKDYIVFKYIDKKGAESFGLARELVLKTDDSMPHIKVTKAYLEGLEIKEQ